MTAEALADERLRGARTGCPRSSDSPRASDSTIVCVHVDADDVRGRLGKGDGKRQADVAEPDDPDLHAISLGLTRAALGQPRGDEISRPRGVRSRHRARRASRGCGPRPRRPASAPATRGQRDAQLARGDRERERAHRRCPPRQRRRDACSSSSRSMSTSASAKAVGGVTSGLDAGSRRAAFEGFRGRFSPASTTFWPGIDSNVRSLRSIGGDRRYCRHPWVLSSATA